MRPFLVALAGLGGLLAVLVIGGLMSAGKETRTVVVMPSPSPTPAVGASPVGR